MIQDISDLGRNLRKIRHTQGLNQRELSLRAGVSQATISRVEAGLVRQVRSESLSALASALQVSLDVLIAGPADEDRDQRRRHMHEVVEHIRLQQAGRWLKQDFTSAATGLAQALVDNGVLPTVVIYRIDVGEAAASRICQWPAVDETGEHHELDDLHPMLRCARDGRSLDIETATGVAPQAEFYVPLRRHYPTRIVLYTGCALDQAPALRRWLVAVRPLLDEFSLVAELTTTTESEGAATPWGRFALDATVVEEQGHIIDVNDAFLQMAGYDRDDLKGRTVFGVLRNAGQQQVENVGDLSRHATLTTGTGATIPVDVRSHVVRRDGVDCCVRIVRDNRDARHELAVTRIQRSFLEATVSNLEPVLQAAFGEIIGLGVSLQGLGINLLSSGQQSFVAHTLLHPARMYVGELRHEGDFRDWLAHWQRREVWIRPWPHAPRDDGYAPFQVIDVPFRDGTVAAGLGQPHETYPGFLQLFKRVADGIDAGLARLRTAERDANPVLRAAWNASRHPAAIIDSRGMVCDTNAAWNLVATALGLAGAPQGYSLVEHCAGNDGVCHHDILTTLREVFNGSRIEVTATVDCAQGKCPLTHGSDRAQWLIRACRLDVPTAHDSRILLSLLHDDGARV